MDVDLEIIPQDEHFRNHKVVVFPKSSVREMAAATENQKHRLSTNHNLNSSPVPSYLPTQTRQQQPRLRSLSAGRVRQSSGSSSGTGGGDLVQDLYDRMGVNLRKGQSSVVGGASPGDLKIAEPRGRPSASPSTHNGLEEEAPRRARSLSQNRRRLANRWPPGHHHTNSNSHARPEEEELMPAPPHSISPKPRSSIPALSLSPQPMQQRRVIAVQKSPSFASFSSRGEVAEEKKEDNMEGEQHQPRTIQKAPSLKDRINAYGAASGGSIIKPSTSSSSSVVRRSVDPSYAASFANRDHPPKVDIYEGLQQESTEEEEQELPLPQSKPSWEEEPPAPLVHVSNHKMTIPPKSPVVDQDRTPISSPRHNTSRPKTTGNLANAYMAAIHGKQSSQPLQPPIQPSLSFKSNSNNNSVDRAPVAEITMGEHADMGGMDSHSLAGASTLSGEEFSTYQNQKREFSFGHNKKPSWGQPAQERDRVANFRSPNAPPKSNPSHHVNTTNINSTVNSTDHHNLQQQQAVPGYTPNSEVERMIEERVQAQVTDLEVRFEQRLRTLVGQMEDKIMQRLDTLELKMTAAVTKKK